MRYLSIVFGIAICFATPVWPQHEDSAKQSDTVEQAAEQEHVLFDGQTLNLAWQGNNPGETVKEYIPAGEDLESWTKLASIREYAELNDVQALVGNFVRVIKQKNSSIPVELHENDQTGAAILEFIVWPGEGALQDAEFVEYNIFKYEKKESGGVIAQQYALREYRDIDGFLRRLKPIKERLLKQMSGEGLQLVPAGEAAADAEESEDSTDSDESSP